MEEGFLLDQAHGTMVQPKWMEGPPEKSFWTGVKMSGRVKIKVTTLRCVKCGFLESYANGDVS